MAGMEALEGRALLATLYVDGSYAGVGDGSQAAPFRQIQAAINAAAGEPGSEIHIAAGTYEEDLTIAQSVKLLGPNADINPNTPGAAARQPEAILVPKTDNPSAGRMIFVTGNNVTIAGLTIDGHNDRLSRRIVLNGVSVNSSTGIGNIASAGQGQPAVIDGLTVKNNIIQNLTSFAVIGDVNDFSLKPLAISRNNVISNNRIDNIPDNNLTAAGGAAFNPGRGISIEHNFYADVTGNVITRTGTPIQAIFMLDNPGRGPYSISNNEVHSYSMGIYLWTIDSEVPAFDVANNRVFAENDALQTLADNSGIRLNRVLHATGVTLRNNDVKGAHSGLLLQWTANTPTLTVSGGTLDGNDYGVVMTNDAPPGVSAPAQAILDGVAITNSHTAALRIMDVLPTANTRVNLTVLGTSTLTGNARGAELTGSEAGLIESVAPVVTLTGPPPAQTTGTTASFPFAVTDNVSSSSDLVVQYKLDNGPLSSATSPIGLASLMPGTHTLLVQATDQAGNTGSKTFTWTVNAVPPPNPPAPPSTPVLDPASDTGSPGDGLTRDDTPTFSGTAPAGNTVTLLDGQTILGTTTADSSGAWSFTVGGAGSLVVRLAGGAHAIAATDKDSAGGVSLPSGALAIVVDRVSPSVSISGVPPKQTTDTSATFTYSATDNATSGGNLVLQYSLDGGGLVTAASPVTLTNLLVGMHTFVVQATDAAGNTGSASYSWTVNGVAPPQAPSTPRLDAASDTGLSSGDCITADNAPTFTGTAPAGTTVTLFADSTMLGTTTADSSGQWSFTVGGAGAIVPSLADGRYSIRATASNSAGSSVLSGARSVLIDTIAPSIQTARTPEPNSAGWNRGDVVASYLASDAGSGLASSAVGSYTFTSQGANQYRVFTVKDVAGNTASATVGPVNIDSGSLSATVAASPNVLQPADGRQVNVTVSGQIKDSLSGPGGTLSYTVRDSYKQLSSSGTAKVGANGAYSFTLSLPAALNKKKQARTFTITVTARDAAGNSKTVSTSVRVPEDGSGSLSATKVKLSKAMLQRLAYLARHRR